jgi:UPF0489 domain
MKVVESHHQVLSVWAEYRRKCERAPVLLTLDHHTDTSLPFRSHLGKQFPKDRILQEEQRQNLLKQISYLDAVSVMKAEALLSHDEHILTALNTDILSSAFVIAQNARDTDLETYRQHRVCCYSVGRSGAHVSLSECDHVLESSFLRSAIEHFNQIRKQNGEGELLEGDYILDVDLDYFNTMRAVNPQNPQLYKQLYKKAGLVTVATETVHVLLCSRESGLTSTKLLESLEQLHASAD